MDKKTYELKGLSCASCAAKIEDSLNTVEGISSAQIVFATQKLNIKVADKNVADDMLKKIRAVVNNHEPDVEVMEFNSKIEGIQDTVNLYNIKKDILFLILSSILFAVGLIVKAPSRIEFAIFGLSYIIIGSDVLIKAGKNIARGQLFDEYFLMSIATIGAFIIREFPEATAVMLFYKTGQLLQDIAVNKSRRSIKSLVGIRPDYANLKVDGVIKKVNPSEVVPGDIIIIKPGEKIPLDGTVVIGSSMVDTSAITGESVPRSVKTGDEILSGFINQNSVLEVVVSKSFQESTVSKILDLVENAASRKSPTENFITKFARYYTPFVVITALAIALLPPVLTGSYNYGDWFYRSLIFLVVSCPCALVVSVPLSFFGGIGGASKRGILVKGSNYLEGLNSVNTVVFDKTGTLTKGVFKVSQIVSTNGFTKDEVLEYAALAESHSSHPIAKSILQEYNDSIDTANIQSFEEIPGHGIKALVNGMEITAGNDKLLHLNKYIEHDTCHIEGTVVHISVDEKYAGYILISDQLKEDTEYTAKELRKLGIRKLVMLSGDSKKTANDIAKRLNFDEVYSELLPHQKVEKLEELQKNNRKEKVVFVGDGINDAPVLARADIGIAMGGLGSDAAIEASDIVLMTDEPSKLLEAFKTARKTRSIVWQNIILALSIKAVVMFLGAGGIATMWEAVFADVGVTLLAVFNSLRVLKIK